MSDILIAGKELPDCLELAESFIENKKVFTAAKPDAEIANFDAEGIFSCNWNKSSAISARSFIIKAETKLKELNEYLIYFDAVTFASKFELDRTENVSTAVESMITSYQFLVTELLLRLEQRKDPVVVSFLVKTYPSKFETLHNGTKAVNLVPCSNIVSAAQAAFISLAENVSILVADKPYLSVLLAKCEPGNDFYSDETGLGKWVMQGMDALSKSKSKQTAKQAATWIKVGQKVSAGFSLFK